MPRFFVNNIIDDKKIIIDGEDANHIGRSLRMKTGDEITACSNGKDYFCRIAAITSDTVCLDVLSSEKSKNEPDIDLTLFQAIPKSDKLETIIQKSVELGVSRIVPVITKRCVSRPDSKSFSKKLKRYRKISAEASKQSGRAIIPEIDGMITLEEASERLSSFDSKIVCYENGGVNFSKTEISKNQKIALFIGSEGGFDPSEIELLKRNGCMPVWLGNRILRCETAPVAAISIIMNLTENM